MPKCIESLTDKQRTAIMKLVGAIVEFDRHAESTQSINGAREKPCLCHAWEVLWQGVTDALDVAFESLYPVVGLSFLNPETTQSFLREAEVLGDLRKMCQGSVPKEIEPLWQVLVELNDPPGLERFDEWGRPHKEAQNYAWADAQAKESADAKAAGRAAIKIKFADAKYIIKKSRIEDEWLRRARVICESLAEWTRDPWIQRSKLAAIFGAKEDQFYKMHKSHPIAHPVRNRKHGGKEIVLHNIFDVVKANPDWQPLFDAYWAALLKPKK